MMPRCKLDAAGALDRDHTLLLQNFQGGEAIMMINSS